MQAAFTFTTTHHAELKEEAESDPMFVNAAMEFDIVTLRPTYRLEWGALGASNALAVAESSGFDIGIVNAARAAKSRLTQLTSARNKREKISGAIEVRFWHQYIKPCRCVIYATSGVFLISRNVGKVTPKIMYSHYL